MAQFAAQLKRLSHERYIIYYTNATGTATGTYTVGPNDFFLACSGTFTVTLPTATGKAGAHYHIKNTGTGTITVTGNGSETIDNAANLILEPLDSAHLISDGTEFWII